MIYKLFTNLNIPNWCSTFIVDLHIFNKIYSNSYPNNNDAVYINAYYNTIVKI